MKPLALVLVGSRRINKRMIRFVEGLGDSGFEPVVASLPRHGWETSAVEDPSVLGRRGRFTLRPASAAVRGVRRPSLIVCMHWSLLPVAVVFGRLTGAALIYDDHDHYELLALEGAGPSWLNRFRGGCVRRVHGWCLPRADLVTCIRLAGGTLADHLGRDGAPVIELHNHPSRRWARPDAARSHRDGSIAIVYVGGIWEEKGCATMLDAFELLADDPSLPELSLQVFGRGDPEIERRLAAAPEVRFHGSTPPSEIIDFLTGHDCIGLVLFQATPRYSLASTNCVKLFEYLAAGVPTVATDLGELGEIVERLRGGWIVPADLDADQLAATLRTIVADPDEVRRRGDEAAASMVREDLWWDREWAKVEGSGVLAAARDRAASTP